MKKAIAFLLVNLLLCASIFAEERILTGPYLSGMIGPNFRSVRNGLETDVGIVFGVACGYKFCNNVRLEGEIAYRRNGFEDEVVFLNIPFSDNLATFKTDTKGNLQTATFMANIWYDFDCFEGCWYPYVGAGIGYGYHELSFTELVTITIPNQTIFIPSDKIRDSRDGFTLQAMCGIAYKVDDCHDLGLEYRYCQSKIHAFVHGNHSAVLSLRHFF